MKRARGAFEASDVRKEVFAVGKMCGEERNLLRKRFRAELVAVRGLLEKADQFLAPGAVEAYRGGAPPSSSSGLAAPPGKEEARPLLGDEPRSDGLMKADDGKAAERTKTSPLAEPKEAPKMTPAERQQLAFSLAALAAELSHHAVELLPKQSNGGRREIIEVNVNAMEDAALFELKMHVDKLVKTRDPSLPPPQDDSKIVENEDQNGKRVDICPGVSPAMIAPSPLQLEILEYAGVFIATGLVGKVLSPLPQKYLALAEKSEKEHEHVAEVQDDDEYIDICGDASPLAIENLGGAISRIPSITVSSDSDSDSDSDGDTSDSDSRHSGSVSDKHSDEKVGSTPAPPILPKVSIPDPAVLSKVNDCSSLPSLSSPAVVQNGELKKLDSPAPAILPKVNGHSAGRPSEPAPVVHNAEPENVSSLAPSALCKMVDDFAQPSEPAPEVVLQNREPNKHISPTPAVVPMVSGDSAGQAPLVHNAEEPEKVSSPAPEVLIIHKVVDDSAPSLEAAPEVVQNGETEKLSSPTPSVRILSKVNDGSSSLPSPKHAPEVAQNAEPENKNAAGPPSRSMGELIAAALEKRRREERSQAREKARQELVETERSAMTSHRVHPADMERLGLVHVEHMVSQQSRPGVPPSLLQQLGLFLRADEDDDGGEQQQQACSDPGVEDLEEGEIPL